MAVGRRGLSHGEVKSICDSLECSPSANDDGPAFRGHPNVTPGGRSANAKSYHLSTPESSMTFSRNTKIAGFSDKFARGARQGI
jgi:hypothetical protein